MESKNILKVLHSNYDLNIQNIEFLRDGGSCSYAVYGMRGKYFLRIIRPPFLETARQSAEIHMYLLGNKFSVIPIIFTKEGTPYVRTEDQGAEYYFFLYEYIDGGEPDSEDTEKVGELIGKLHRLMKSYKGELQMRDKHFFIDRYVEILRKVNCRNAEGFLEYGDELWESVKDPPRGYCHGDLYTGNIHKSGFAMYVVDFDTSCNGFPVYDAVLFCNDTNYFEFDCGGYERARVKLDSFLKGYLKHYKLSAKEISAFYDLIAVYHFQLQATIMEMYVYDCVDTEFFDAQYDWLVRWKKQCGKMSKL